MDSAAALQETLDPQLFLDGATTAAIERAYALETRLASEMAKSLALSRELAFYKKFLLSELQKITGAKASLDILATVRAWKEERE
jgi:hypothetical protein